MYPYGKGYILYMSYPYSGTVRDTAVQRCMLMAIATIQLHAYRAVLMDVQLY